MPTSIVSALPMKVGIWKKASSNRAASKSIGVGVRAVSGDKTAFAYADSLCIDSINRSAKAVRVIGAAGGEASIKVPTPAYGKPVHMAIDPIASLDSAAKVALLNKVETLAKAADPRIVQVMAGLTCEYDMVYIARLDGKHAADVRPMVRMNVTVIAKQGERREQGSAGGGGRYDWRISMKTWCIGLSIPPSNKP